MNFDNMALLTDLYEITMMQGYFESNIKNKICYFDLFYRVNPCKNGYAIAAGLEQVIEYVKHLKFSESDLEYLSSNPAFSKEFLEYLRDFKFTGDIYAVPEGTVVFPNEPLIRVKAPIMEAQLLETALLNIINHQSLIATKAARVKWAAGNDSVLEFGLRRAQGPDAGIYGARAAVIAGCDATSNVLAGKMFGIPIAGTHAHSWVMSFEREIDAFREYARVFPDNIFLLVDTYDTLKSGVPNAIKVFDEFKARGRLNGAYGIRLDSGDLSYISKEARRLLDKAGHERAVISASSDLDEHLISSLKLQGSKITLWGVGTNLITSSDCPSFGGVYKLAAEVSENGSIVPKIKLSENSIKVTNPGVKKIFRLYNKETGKIKADLIALDYETIDETKDLEIFDPQATWKRMILRANEFTARELLIPIFVDGKACYESPSVMEIKAYCKQETETLWDEHKRLMNPQIMPVDLSLDLYNMKQALVHSHRE